VKIAISGFAGSGKTALAKGLVERLNALGLDVKLVAPTFKDLAKARGMDLMEFQKEAEKNPEIDKEFDGYIRREAKKYKNVVVATWLAIYLINADLSIFLYAPLLERAKRVALRDNIKVEEALKHVTERDEENRQRYLALYNIDIFKLYEMADLCINSSRFSIDQEVDLVLSVLKVKSLI